MTALTIMAWNCAGGFLAKSHVVTGAKPDIAIISEIGEVGSGQIEGATSVASIGTANGRGLAIIGFDGWRIERADLAIEEQLFLPVRASRGEDQLQLVGACVRPDGGYVPPMLRAIKTLEPFIRSAPTIVAGDFNQSAEFDARRKPGPGRRFADVVGALDVLGLRSAWHAHRQEQFGSESAPTHFHRSSKTSWHIDYAFVPRKIEVVAADLHSFDDIVVTKISDHVPLRVSLVGRLDAVG